MNVYLQGMRRSGTTIVFDILSEDHSFDCYYEPLAAASKKAEGGGSGVRKEDFFEKIRAVRARFLSRYPGLDASLLNYGAPRDAGLEFEESLPEYCRDYIRFMLSHARDTVIKFTRMYRKVAVLKQIDPEAKFVHIVRNPRAVVTSYLYGTNQKNKRRFEGNDLFFARQSEASAWSSFAFSEHIRHLPEYSHLSEIKDFERVLLIWKYDFIESHFAGKEHFGDNYFLLSHDALTTQTEATIQSLYRFLERPVPSQVVQWAKFNVRYRPSIHEPASSVWPDSFAKMDLQKELDLMAGECGSNGRGNAQAA